MHLSSLIVGLAGISAATAAALPKPAPIVLEQDDIIVYGQGKHQIMKRHEWDAHQAERLAEVESQVRRRFANLSAPEPPTNYQGPAPLSKRQCAGGEVDEVQITNTETFLQWDIVMSPVITARYDQATVSMTQGYQLSNSVSVSQSAEIGLKEWFKTTLQVSFETSWTTIESQAYTYFLNPTDAGEAMHGLIVSNPATTRYTGNYITGCSDNPTKEAFSADVYAEEKKSGGLTWVEGTIGLAASTKYPVPCLIGECEHK